MDRHVEHLKTAADVGSVGTVLATLAGWLPEAAAFVSLVWGLIRIWETETVRRLTRRRQ